MCVATHRNIKSTGNQKKKQSKKNEDEQEMYRTLTYSTVGTGITITVYPQA